MDTSGDREARRESDDRLSGEESRTVAPDIAPLCHRTSAGKRALLLAETQVIYDTDKLNTGNSTPA